MLGMRWYRGCEWFINCCVKIILENGEVKTVKERERGRIRDVENCTNRLPGR